MAEQPRKKKRIRDLLCVFALLFVHSGLACPCLQTHWNLKLDWGWSMCVGVTSKDLGSHSFTEIISLKCSLLPAFLLPWVQGPAAFQIFHSCTMLCSNQNQWPFWFLSVPTWTGYCAAPSTLFNILFVNSWVTFPSLGFSFHHLCHSLIYPKSRMCYKIAIELSTVH